MRCPTTEFFLCGGSSKTFLLASLSGERCSGGQLLSTFSDLAGGLWFYRCVCVFWENEEVQVGVCGGLVECHVGVTSTGVRVMQTGAKRKQNGNTKGEKWRWAKLGPDAEGKTIPTCHVMVSMALTNQRRSSQGRKTSYGNERAVDKSKARSQNIKG